MMQLPPYKSFPVLSNREVFLREAHADDLTSLQEIQYYDGIQARSVSEADKMQERINEDYVEGNSVHWIIVQRSTGAVAGTCGYYRGFEDSTGEIGCILLPRFRGCGLMTKALELVVAFGWNEIGLTKITAITSPENNKAIRLLDKLDFGRTRESDKGVVFERTNV